MRVCAVIAAMVLGACSSVSMVRLQPEQVYVGAGLEAVAAIQTNVMSVYVLFVPLPGSIDLDRVINRMLIVSAKTMGADKVVDLRFSITPDHGLWTLRKLLGWRSAEATGIAVRVIGPVPDPGADQGPEPAAPAPAAPAAPTETPR